MDCQCMGSEHRARRLVVTGGPGAGKTAVLEVARREFCRHVVVLREAATIVFGGGFPRRPEPAACRRAQLAIFHVQEQLEELERDAGTAALLLCDRGIVDGLAYWPAEEAEFWRATGTTRDEALRRYDVVIHLRPPAEGHGYENGSSKNGNAVRTETAKEAALIDARIEAAWSGHPCRHFVASTEDFMVKVRATLELVAGHVPSCCAPGVRSAA
jgi:predicted ATPase